MMADPTLSAGVEALEQGRYADALAIFAPLAKQRPGDTNVLLALASAQLGAGDARSALATATEARSKVSNATAPLYLLAPAAALADEEQTFRACLTHLTSIALNEALGIGAFWTARLIEHNHFVAAARVQRQLVALAPNDYDVRLAEADTLLRMGETEAAGAALAEALRIDATRGEAHALKAQQRVQAGDLDGARRSALAAISRSPHAVPAYAALADLDASALDDDMLSRLRETMKQDRTPPENRAAAGMALAAALDSRGRHDEAFAAILDARHDLARANVQRGKPYRREETAAKLANEMRLFSVDALRTPPPDPARGQGLVFIVGMPRSGSTLVDQALSRHSQVVSRGESRALQAVRAQFDAELAESANQDALVERRGAQWERLYRTGALAGPVLVDKNLFNFWNVGLIARLLPSARIVLVRRDPVDVCFSIFKRAFIGEHPFANDIEDLAHYHRCFDRLADHWRAALPHTVLEVNYEALVQDFETGLRAILAHCGLKFEPACVRFHESDRAVITSSAAQVRQPLFTTGIGRSRPYTRQLQPLIAALARHKQT